MYRLFRTKRFEKSFKQVKRSGKLSTASEKSLNELLKLLERGERLPTQYRDHQLTGELKEYRECHIKGDLLLLYQIREQQLVLALVNIGSHSYLNL